MQALSVLPLLHTFSDSGDFSFVSGNFDRDFRFKLKIDDNDEKFEEQDEEKQEQEFSFACPNPHGSFVTADEIFDNGRIRPISPFFDQSMLFAAAQGNPDSLPLHPPLKKLFVDRRRVFPSGSEPYGARKEPHRELSRETTTLEVEVKDSRERCQKSNSTGFSKLWMYRRDVKLRSNSDGKDAFIFLNPPAAENPFEAKKVKKNDVIKIGKRKTAPSSSAHEQLYVMNRKRKESDKRRSFLPYKQQLVGFFANVNGFSRNLHPF